MNERIFVKPAQGLLVRKPVGGYLLAEGEEVNRETYWLRRLNDGDVLEVQAAAEPEPVADKPAKTKL